MVKTRERTAKTRISKVASHKQNEYRIIETILQGVSHVQFTISRINILQDASHTYIKKSHSHLYASRCLTSYARLSPPLLKGTFIPFFVETSQKFQSYTIS